MRPLKILLNIIIGIIIGVLEYLIFFVLPAYILKRFLMPALPAAIPLTWTPLSTGILALLIAVEIIFRLAGPVFRPLVSAALDVIRLFAIFAALGCGSVTVEIPELEAVVSIDFQVPLLLFILPTAILEVADDLLLFVERLQTRLRARARGRGLG